MDEQEFQPEALAMIIGMALLSLFIGFAGPNHQAAYIDEKYSTKHDYDTMVEDLQHYHFQDPSNINSLNPAIRGLYNQQFGALCHTWKKEKKSLRTGHYETRHHRNSYGIYSHWMWGTPR